MERFIREGISKSDIRVLTFYKGQIRTIYRSAHDVPELANINSVSTVDSYQGQEAPVVVPDLVAAANIAAKENVGSGSPYEGATQHVRNPNRLCLALTRAKYGLVVVVANVRIVGSAQKAHYTAAFFICCLMMSGNAISSVDSATPDTHPTALQMRANDSQYRRQVQEEANELTGLMYVREVANDKRKPPPKTKQRPVKFRTATDSVITTLPEVPKSVEDKIVAATDL
ncbi:hypothetical protein MMC16_005413, partial [Acarospora aff. strigata]|nr:hypothetical protein [Acarospora aff. strigata]